MIRVEAAREGFTLSVGGRPVLAHALRRPCLALGSAELHVRRNKGAFRLRARRARWTQLRSFKVLESGPSRVLVDFAGKLRVRFSLEGGRLVLDFPEGAPAGSLLRLRLAAFPEEHLYGCGEQFSRLDLKGSRVPLWVQEQGVGRGLNPIGLLAELRAGAGGAWHTTYYASPVFVSSRNYYLVAETEAHAVLDFRRPAQTVLECWDLPRRIVIGSGKDAVSTLADLTALLGRGPGLPTWTWDGAWLGLQGGIDAVERRLDRALEAGVKVGAVWAQDWCGRRATSFGSQLMWDWRPEESLYPDLRGRIAGLRRRGVRFLGYLNPFLAVEGSLYAEAREAGYCVKDRQGADYLVTVTTFPAAMLDLTNPEARAWMKAVIARELLGNGISGWMADFGEYLPTDCVLASGEDPLLLHNRWPVLWARLNAEAIEEAGAAGEATFFVRSGWLGSVSAAPAAWAGDQLVDFSRDDGLPSVVPALISSGFSGLGFNHSDVGGYTTVAWIKRSRECLARWAELSAFGPVFRSHEGNRPESNVQLDSDEGTLALAARMTEVFSSLKPYHDAVAREYRELGLPAIRHPFLHYEGDEELHARAYQYLYGRDLFVAPTLRPGRELTSLHLPEDEWVHLWSSRRFRGGPATVDSPVGFPAVFYRAASPFAPLFDAIRRRSRKV